MTEVARISNKKRIEWLDFARGICAFCVMLAHLDNTPELYKVIFTPFFLMLFFFISGFLYKEYPLIESIKRLLNGLILPYFALNFIHIAIGFDNLTALTNGNYNYVIEKIINVFLGKTMWFIPCIILVQTYYLIILQLAKRVSFKLEIVSKFGLFVIFLGSVYLIRNWNYESTYWYADNALFALAYFILGSIFKETKLCFRLPQIRHIKFYSYLILVLFFIVAYFSQKLLNVEFHVMTNYYRSPFYFFFISIAGIATIVFFTQNAIDYNNKTYNLQNYLRILGQNSLLLFAFDGKSRAIVFLVFDKLKIDELITSNYIYVILFCALQGLLIILLSLFVNKYLPYIVGKKVWIK